jgi:hypothetical protein
MTPKSIDEKLKPPLNKSNVEGFVMAPLVKKAIHYATIDWECKNSEHCLGILESYELEKEEIDMLEIAQKVFKEMGL